MSTELQEEKSPSELAALWKTIPKANIVEHRSVEPVFFSFPLLFSCHTKSLLASIIGKKKTLASVLRRLYSYVKIFHLAFFVQLENFFLCVRNIVIS